MKSFFAVAGWMVASMICGTGCSLKYERLTEPNADYKAALEATAAECTQDPKIAEKGLRSIQNLFRTYTPANIRAHVRETYADTFFFRDGFKYITKIDDLETYMVHGAEPLRSCTFDFEPPIDAGDGNYYLKWIMNVSLESDPKDHVDRALGLSHLRFNQDGKVIFHQDYWDPTDVLYRRIPIANRMIGFVRKRL